VRLHDLRPAKGATHKKKRLGRGESSGRGKTSGRGQKGQRSRNTVHPWFEGGQMPIQRRLPKFGGFTSRNRVEYAVVNVSKIADNFDSGATVTPADLVSKGLVRKNEKVKVLANGDIAKALTIKANKFSKVAEEKIKAAGGSIEVI
jgi:large subunit ribosomal protein L15